MRDRTSTQYAGDYLVSTLAPTRGQKRFAFGFLLVLVALTAVALYMGRAQLPRIDAFVPAFTVAILTSDLLTAFLLFAQFSILRSRALIAISSGYLFSGLITLPWALTSPGIFPDGGFLGAGPQTTAWLYLFWHAGFPLFGIAYALLKQDRGQSLWHGSVQAAILWNVVIVIGIVCALTVLATAGQDLLPRIAVSSGDLSPAWIVLLGCSALVTALAAILVLLRRSSMLDLWLLVVMVAFLLQLVVAFGTRARFTVTWYTERTFALLATALLLFVLLYETATLYGQLVRALLAQRRERTARLTMQDMVSASIAHEVRQPVAAMTMNAEAGLRWLGRETPDLEEVRAVLRRIVQDGDRAASVIEKTRAAFTTGAGVRTLLEVGNLVRESLVLAHAELQTHRISVAVTVADRPSLIMGDQVQLQQVMLNLISNAIDAMVTLKDGERKLRIECNHHQSGGVMVLVEDSGKGVTPSDLDRIFDPLFTTKSQGMGLAICRSIVEAHQGTLRVSPDGSRGAVFELVFPAAAASAPSQPTAKLTHVPADFPL
jgi:signal transduction histidine kinase